jgi:hypothetical protein
MWPLVSISLAQMNSQRTTSTAYASALLLLRNRLSPRFINKAATAEPIQGGEKNLLQSRSKIKQKKNTEKLNLPLKTVARNPVESGLHNY